MESEDTRAATPTDLERFTAYSYLTVSDPASRASYFQIMRIFTSTLLADLSAHEVAERLGRSEQPGTPNGSVDNVAARLEQLKEWGNLLPSSRPVKASSIRDYHRVRSRFQLSPLGEHVQRQAEEILAAADAVREVSRELLALVARGLAGLATETENHPQLDPRDALERISAVFTQFGEFADSVRDFYAYLGQVIFRYDLDSVEFAGFKELLLDYAETITEDVAHYAPQIRRSLDLLAPHLPDVLKRVDDFDQGLQGLSRVGVEVQRSRGRELADWEGLRAWFFDDGEGSQVDQLREATMRALQALLANAKRLIRTSTGELSRRKDLLKLARWFDTADDATAHDLYVAAFGIYGARHLGIAPDHDLDVPATTSWWSGPTVPVPLALRERGSRAPRGRTAAAEDYTAQRDWLRQEAQAEAERRHAAAAELRGAGGRWSDVRLSGSATRLLLDLLARCLATAPPTFDIAASADADLEVRVRLRRSPGTATVVRGFDGDLILDDLTLVVDSPSQRLEAG
ncbi:TIGR02677 family protein [Actinopolymorpha sp. NPDC004070]|uniref:TIGR02677 family protein n=1 Tax=Actinopolymorpha sp. NPDC004070 TaxID=3154548 RepID=UPI0033B771B0